MRLKEYSLSKAPYLIINLLIYLLVFILFRIADVSYKELAVIFLIWFLPMITYFLIEFFVRRIHFEPKMPLQKTFSPKSYDYYRYLHTERISYGYSSGKTL